LLLPEIIHTKRLHLRRPHLEDAHEVFQNYGSDPEATRFVTWPTHRTVDDAFEALRARLAHWERGTEFSWSITPPDDSDCVMGMISVSPDIRYSWRWSIGYVLGRQWWGKGYMTEAVRAVKDELFRQPVVQRVWAWVDEDNYASMRVLVKAGFTREGVLHRWSLHPQMGATPRDCWTFAALR
jgi:ribosomal-protein-alanine N-acetyltransferase